MEKKGKWIEKWDSEHFFSYCICSVCTRGTGRDKITNEFIKSDFCPHCGADMRGDTP